MPARPVARSLFDAAPRNRQLTRPRFGAFAAPSHLQRRAVALALAACASTAFAQAVPDAAAQPKQPDPGVRDLGQVSVTARPIDEYQAKDSDAGALGELPLLSTPFSINVITHDLLVDQQAAFLGDFLKNDPSASIGNVVISFATLRGFSIGDAGFLYDGLPLGSLLNDGRVGMQSIDRVEILKGASTFLYGLGSSSSLGGALNFVPKKPVDAPVRDAAVTYTSDAQFGVLADVGDRFGPDRQFGFRLNAGFRDGDGAVDDFSWRQRQFAGTFDWRINRDVKLEAGIYYVDNKFDGIQPFFVGASNGDGSPIVPIPAAPNLRHAITPSWNTFDQDSTIGSLRADWSIAPGWSLTAQYGNGRNNRPYDGTHDTRFGVLNDASGDLTLFASQEGSRVDAQAGQALLHGNAVTGPLTHNITLAASATEEKNYDSFQIAGFLPGNLYSRVDAPEPATVPMPALEYSGKTTTTGFLASDIIGFDEHWSVLVGGRQAEVKTYDADGTQPPGGSASRFSPAAALMWKPTRDSLVYFNYAEGLEPGGTAPDGTANAGQAMSPLVTDQYELGGKVDLGELTLTAAVFDMKRPLQFRDATNVWVSSGEQEHRGLELMASGKVTEDLRVVAGAMFLDAKQRSTGDPTTEGKHVAGVPDWTANLYAEYRIAAVPGLYLNAGVYYSAKQYFDNANLQSIPSWTRFDVGARYETRIGGYDTAFLVAVENVGDHDYWQSALGNALTLGDPLTVKATARVSF
jgi:iron complex outermembrane recepter protein